MDERCGDPKQSRHASGFLAPVLLLYLPAVQFVQLFAPVASMKVPGPQAVQAVARMAATN